MDNTTVIVIGPKEWFPADFFEIIRRKYPDAIVTIERIDNTSTPQERFTLSHNDPLVVFQIGAIHASFIEPNQ